MLYIHIGKGKTGTTFLQNKIFSKHNSINYLAKCQNNYPNWLKEWHYFDDYYFELNKKHIQHNLSTKLKPNNVNLISSEAFTIVGYWYQQALRIKKIAPKAKIILTLRDPITTILSFYKYNVKAGYFYESIDRLIDWSNTPRAFYLRKPIYLPDYYYNNIINTYKSLFGNKNLLVLKYENMINNPDQFFYNLFNFLKIDKDLNMIKSELCQVENFSLNDSEVYRYQMLNLYHEIRNNFPNFNYQFNDIDENYKYLISESTKDRLIEYLKGKCFGYY